MIGYSYTTTDLVAFDYTIENGLLVIDDLKTEIAIDMTEESSKMLMELFRYIHTYIKETNEKNSN